MNISGAGKHDTLVDCKGSHRALLTSASLWMSSLTVLNGYNSDDGGGLAVIVGASREPLTIAVSNVSVVNCGSNSSGGGIAVEMVESSEPVAASFHDVDVLDNAAVIDGGGVYLYGFDDGVWNVTVTGCTFSRNSASEQLFGNVVGRGKVASDPIPIPDFRMTFWNK